MKIDKFINEYNNRNTTINKWVDELTELLNTTNDAQDASQLENNVKNWLCVKGV